MIILQLDRESSELLKAPAWLVAAKQQVALKPLRKSLTNLLME
jgi:hypothetical protein